MSTVGFLLLLNWRSWWARDNNTTLLTVHCNVVEDRLYVGSVGNIRDSQPAYIFCTLHWQGQESERRSRKRKAGRLSWLALARLTGKKAIVPLHTLLPNAQQRLTSLAWNSTTYTIRCIIYFNKKNLHDHPGWTIVYHMNVSIPNNTQTRRIILFSYTHTPNVGNVVKSDGKAKRFLSLSLFPPHKLDGNIRAAVGEHR